MRCRRGADGTDSVLTSSKGLKKEKHSGNLFLLNRQRSRWWCLVINSRRLDQDDYLYIFQEENVINISPDASSKALHWWEIHLFVLFSWIFDCWELAFRAFCKSTDLNGKFAESEIYFEVEENGSNLDRKHRGFEWIKYDAFCENVLQRKNDGASNEEYENLLHFRCIPSNTNGKYITLFLAD